MVSLNSEKRALHSCSTLILRGRGTELEGPSVKPGGARGGDGAQGRSLHIPPVPQHGAYTRVRSSEKCLLFLRTELENRVDLAEAGGGVDIAFVVVSPAAWGNQYRPTPYPLQPLWVEGAGKLEELLWPALQAQVPPVQGTDKGQEGERDPSVSPRARVPGSHLHAGTPGMGPHFLDPHTLNTPVLGGASEDWLVPGRHLGIVILHSMFGGCCPICSGVGPQTSGHTSHSDHQAQAGQGYPSHPSCRPSATSSLDLVASGGQNPRAPEQRGRQTAPSVT